MSCTHPKYVHDLKMKWVKTKVLLGQDALILSVHISCSDCGQPYRFKAVPGFSTEGPMAAHDRTVLLIPLEIPEAIPLGPSVEEEEVVAEDEEKEEPPTVH